MQLTPDPAWSPEEAEANTAALDAWLSEHPPRVMEMTNGRARLEFALPDRTEVVEMPYRTTGVGNVSVGGSAHEGGGTHRHHRPGEAVIRITQAGNSGRVLLEALMAPESYRVRDHGDVELTEAIVGRVIAAGTVGRIQISSDENGIFFAGPFALAGGQNDLAAGQIVTFQPQTLTNPNVRAAVRALAAADKLAEAIRMGASPDEALAAYDALRRGGR